MLRGLVTGVLHDTPLTRTSAGGNTFTTGKLKDDSETPPAWYSVVAFGELSDALSKLTKGDSLSVSGKMTLKLYTGKDGNTRIDASVVADQIATMKRKKKPAVPKADQQHGDRQDDRYHLHEDQQQPYSYSEDEPF
jgi:single-stranded DNA-binding protein